MVERRKVQQIRHAILSCLFLLAIAVASQAQLSFAPAQQGLVQVQPGSVVSWGNGFGRRYKPAPGEEYIAVCAGGFHSLALRSDGSVVAWGENTCGQCNVPRGRDSVAIAAGLYHNLALGRDGTIVAWGDDSRKQCKVPAGSGFRAIAAGNWHSLAIRADGSLVAWGWNDHGQCDVPPGNDYTDIAGGCYHSLALKTDGSIVAWGANGDGQCDVPPGKDFVAIAAGALHNLALKADGTLMAWGRRSDGQCKVPEGNDFTALAAGCLHSLALRRDGSIVMWGPVDYTQYEPPPEGPVALLAAGAFHSLALRGNPVLPLARTRQVAAVKPVEDTRPRTAAVTTSDKPQIVSTDPPEKTAEQKKVEPITPPAPRPSVIPEPNAPVAQPESSRKNVTTAQAAPAPTVPVPEPNAASNTPSATRESQTAPVSPSQVPPVPEPNATPSRPSTVAKKGPAAPAQAPQPKTQAAPEPNVVAGRSSTSEKKEAAPAPQNKTRPAEPNLPADLTDFLRQSIAADSYIGADVNAVPVYHFVSIPAGRHFCTISEKEKYKLIDSSSPSWKYAGIAFFAYPEGKQPPDARGVYRFRSESLDRYYFTLNEQEKEMLVRDFAPIWKYEGVAWYIPAAKPPKPK